MSLDRRSLLAGAGVLAVGTGCGRTATEDEPGGAPQDRSVTSRQGDIELLQTALGLEQQERNPHDRAHAERLREELRDRGAEPAPVPATDPPPSDRIDAAAVAVAFYLDMLPKVYDARLRSLIASILVVESEQLAALRERAGQRPAPDAFVYGVRS